MKCINKFITLLLTGVIILSGCGSTKYDMPYTADSKISSFRIVESTASVRRADSFASKLCVSDTDVSKDGISMSASTVGAGLFDINSKNIIFSQNLHEQFNPASLTKIMTAIVALKNASPDMMLTASSNVKNLESGAQSIDLAPGDSMTLAQALNIMLIYSANDVAIMVAEGVGGSVENFVEMMNNEARLIGATHTHFNNPHGLTSEGHYSTPYDLYLMMNEAVKFDLFNEIIKSTEYSTAFSDANGVSKEISLKSTNLYINGSVDSPAGITVIGGKTGTTNAAGHCLIIISRDTNNNPYISVVLKSENRDQLYSNMSVMLGHINN